HTGGGQPRRDQVGARLEVLLGVGPDPGRFRNPRPSPDRRRSKPRCFSVASRVRPLSDLAIERQAGSSRPKAPPLPRYAISNHADSSARIAITERSHFGTTLARRIADSTHNPATTPAAPS